MLRNTCACATEAHYRNPMTEGIDAALEIHSGCGDPEGLLDYITVSGVDDHLIDIAIADKMKKATVPPHGPKLVVPETDAAAPVDPLVSVANISKVVDKWLESFSLSIQLMRERQEACKGPICESLALVQHTLAGTTVVDYISWNWKQDIPDGGDRHGQRVFLDHMDRVKHSMFADYRYEQLVNKTIIHTHRPNYLVIRKRSIKRALLGAGAPPTTAGETPTAPTGATGGC